MKPSALLLLTLFAPTSALAGNVGILRQGLGCSFADVNAALASARSGDVLYIKSGVMISESVTLDFNVTLANGNSSCSGAASAGSTHPVISGAGVLTPLIVNNNAVVEIDAVDFAQGLGTDGGCVRIDSGSAHFVDSSIYTGVADRGGGMFIGDDG